MPKSKPVFGLSPPILLAALLTVLVACGQNGLETEKELKKDLPVHAVWKGDPVECAPASVFYKVNIRGVVKNATALSQANPLKIEIPEGARGLAFAAGLVPESGDDTAAVRVLAGSTTLTEARVDSRSESGWQNLRLDPPAFARSLTIETDRAGPGLFVGHPRPLMGLERPSVVFLLIDALRADALGVYGADGDPTPRLDRIAGQGVVFERTYTASPFTLTSTASIFTGLFPWRHKVLFAEAGGLYLTDPVESLVRRYQKAGYHTVAISGTYFFFSRNGFAAGFDSMDERCAPNFFYESAACLNERIEEWLSSRDGEPVFLYIHYVDPHAPYHAPEPYRHRYLEGIEPPDDDLVLAGEIEQYGKNRKWYHFWKRPDSVDLVWLRGLYQGEASYVDRLAGEAIDKLSTALSVNGLPPYLLVTADHGEAFYEHKVMDHVSDLHEPVMRVPLIIKGPGLPAGARIDAPARSVDFMPTLLELSGLAPPRDISGKSLVPLMLNKSEPPRPAAAVHYTPGAEYAMVLWPYKVFYRPNDEWELYNLLDDPGEKNDLAAAFPQQLQALSELLLELLKLGEGGEAGTEIDHETLKRLQDLGYINP